MKLSPIDLRAALEGDAGARIQAARLLGQAFTETGFAVIVGHGVDERLIEDCYGEASRFFAEPLAEKLLACVPERTKGRGYLPMGIESVSATLAGETPPDLCEALVFPAAHRASASLIWPKEPRTLRELVPRYAAAMKDLTQTLGRLSALALDLEETALDPYFADPSLTLRFVHYPDQPEPPAPGQLRYGAHHDYGGITILRQDNAPGGLQICDLAGSWHDAPQVPQSFLLNVGDLMSRWTNGRWRSTLHRVVNPDRALTGSTARLSLVAFTGPNEKAEIACLPSCADADNPPRYEPVQAGAYIRAMLDKSMNLTQVS